jgi:hypothetical protein
MQTAMKESFPAALETVRKYLLTICHDLCICPPKIILTINPIKTIWGNMIGLFTGDDCTGIVAIQVVAEFTETDYFNILCHELRHAWQWNNRIPYTEKDANAYEASTQLRISCRRYSGDITICEDANEEIAQIEEQHKQARQIAERKWKIEQEEKNEIEFNEWRVRERTREQAREAVPIPQDKSSGMNCYRCERSVQQGSNFCHRCGTKLQPIENIVQSDRPTIPKASGCGWNSMQSHFQDDVVLFGNIIRGALVMLPSIFFVIVVIYGIIKYNP